MNFTCILSEGGLLPADLLEAIVAGSAKTQKEADFNLAKGRRLSDEIATAWNDAQAYWKAFHRALDRLAESDPATSATREQWMLPLLRSLGYNDITFMREAAMIDEKKYPISHRAGPNENYPPVHILGSRSEIGRRSASGGPNPYGLLQEYLNRTDHLWGIVTNGFKFRILRENPRNTPAFVEFDLQRMMEEEKYSEFILFYRLVHRSRLPRDLEHQNDCPLEIYHLEAIETGGRVRDRLRDGVEEALKAFGNGFLSHPENEPLRMKVREGKLKALDYYRQLLHLIYRLLFLMVSEERKLVGPVESNQLKQIYYDHYSINHLRWVAEQTPASSGRHSDLWIGLKTTFRFYCDDYAGKQMGIPPLNGELFGPSAMPDLELVELFNANFLQAVHSLSLYQEDKTARRVNYAALDVEELGSVYESLLDFHPIFHEVDTSFQFDLAFGTERKSTGSYYTRPELVRELIKSALVPVMEERLKEAKNKEAKENTLLGLKVCDPACGSGHFLLAAARRIGKELARVRSGEDEPSPEEFRPAVREVIAHCIYGVDLNPLAVDLCKLALWLEGHNAGKPLSFLDHRIRCGNSLIGAFSRQDILNGIPDEAFIPVTGDDKSVAKALKDQNKREKKEWDKGQQITFDQQLRELTTALAKSYGTLESILDDTPEHVYRKKAQYEKLRADEYREWELGNIWTAAFFSDLVEPQKSLVPTYGKLMERMYFNRQAHGQSAGYADQLGIKHKFFHWFLEFPDAFEQGGFDVVLGNPPWERIKLQEEEFFASRNLEIAKAPNKAVREKLIRQLEEKDPNLWEQFQEAKHFAEAQSKFLRESDRFPLTARGDINTYAIFAEHFRKLMGPSGRAGIIVPTGIATDDTTKTFFADLVQSRTLESYYGFKNERFLFARPVEHTVTFGLLTLVGERLTVPAMTFCWFAYTVGEKNDTRRHITLTSEDLGQLNPNTLTCPIFRTGVDAELTKKIYRSTPILVNEVTGQNAWNVRFRRIFDMNKVDVLEKCLQVYKTGYVRMYEAKLFHQFDHRWATYEREETRNVTQVEKVNAESTVNPRYWISRDEVMTRTRVPPEKDWLLVFRNIARATDERTFIASVLPRAGTDFSTRVIFSVVQATSVLCLLANLNSLVFDYLCRQMLGGTNLSDYITKQLPVILPSVYQQADYHFLVPSTLELIYTAWDIKAFADDVWRDADESLRAAISKECKENKQATSGHEWKLPDWIEAYPEIETEPKKGIPFPPFKWDETRRAVLRAELDAYYAKLYGLTEEELRYILDPQDVYGPDFPGETFRVLKEKETKQFGEYRTKRLVLEAWSRLHQPVPGGVAR